MNKLTITASLCAALLFGCDTPGNKTGISISDNTVDEAYSVVTATGVVRSGEGSICANGGVSIDTGIDLNGDGILNADEVTETYTICNGVNGLDGANGVDGTNGANGVDGVDGANGLDGTNGVDGANGSGATLFIEINTEDPGTNCGFGGKRIEQGHDSNNNGVLDLEEIAETNYVCAIYNSLASTFICKFAINSGTGSTDIDTEIRAIYTLDTLHSGEVIATGEVSTASISSAKTKRWHPTQSGWATGVVGLVFDVKDDKNFGQWIFGVTRVEGVVTTANLYYKDIDNSSDPENEVVLSTSKTVAECNTPPE